MGLDHNSDWRRNQGLDCFRREDERGLRGHKESATRNNEPHAPDGGANRNWMEDLAWILCIHLNVVCICVAILSMTFVRYERRRRVRGQNSCEY